VLQVKTTPRAAVAALVAALAAIPAAAGAAGFIADKSEITFVSKQMGVDLQGRFRKFDGDIVFKPADLAASKARIEVELGSVDLGAAESESEVRGKDWFQVANFPRACSSPPRSAPRAPTTMKPSANSP
jgi:polyisoprenoid-binding protein YceI